MRDIVVHESSSSSSDTTIRHSPQSTNRQPATDNLGHDDENLPPTPDPHPFIPAQALNTFKVFPRDTEELCAEAFLDVIPNGPTDYPCTLDKLNASGGLYRQLPLDIYRPRYNKTFFAFPNNGERIHISKATREVYDHNVSSRLYSASEEKAIGNLKTRFKNAERLHWGPDLAVKTFHDLDTVFFLGKLRGHVWLTWKANKFFEDKADGATYYLENGKSLIQLNAPRIFRQPQMGSSFAQMFATLLHEMCHAYYQVRAFEKGSRGWETDEDHGANFGTMIYAVNKRALQLLGLKGDPLPYPLHPYADNGRTHIDTWFACPAPEKRSFFELCPLPRLKSFRSAPREPSSENLPLVDSNEPEVKIRSQQDLYNDAFLDVTLDTGSSYDCEQSDLDATGGLARRQNLEYKREDGSSPQDLWFRRRNHGPFVHPEQASRDIFEHNKWHEYQDFHQYHAIKRLSAVIKAGRAGFWSTDIIIKAFCDLDIVFFRGALQGHVCVRWIPDRSTSKDPEWATVTNLGEGKSLIEMNADAIILKHPHPFERMFSTMLYQMCTAYAHTQVEEKEMLDRFRRGENFGVNYYDVEQRAQKLFRLSLKCHPDEVFPCYPFKGRRRIALRKAFVSAEYLVWSGGRDRRLCWSHTGFPTP